MAITPSASCFHAWRTEKEGDVVTVEDDIDAAGQCEMFRNAFAADENGLAGARCAVGNESKGDSSDGKMKIYTSYVIFLFY